MYQSSTVYKNLTNRADCTQDYGQMVLAVTKAQTDYSWKGGLKNEATQRLSMWEAAHWGGTYTSGIVQNYKTLTDDAVSREKDFRASGETYRTVLSNSCYPATFVQSELDRIDQNVGISTSDQNGEIANYQSVERDYLVQLQEQEAKALADEQAKVAAALLQKQEQDRQAYGQIANVGIGGGLGILGISILVATIYLRKNKKG